MTAAKPCPDCGSDRLYETRDDVHARGGIDQWTNLLPGLGGIFATARLSILMCQDCGHMRFYGSRDACAQLASSAHWERVKVERS